MDINKDKWHEYGETETDFPDVWNSAECGWFYDAEYVKDWLQRCMDDTPEWNDTIWEKWFEKWFSQFRENT